MTEKLFEIQDATSISKHGIREKSLNFWCHQQRYTSEAVANFWLRRWANAYELCKFSGFLDNIEIQKNDWVTLNFTGFQNVNNFMNIKGLICSQNTSLTSFVESVLPGLESTHESRFSSTESPRKSAICRSESSRFCRTFS
jgi:hypothetical protein